MVPSLSSTSYGFGQGLEGVVWCGRVMVLCGGVCVVLLGGCGGDGGRWVLNAK